jgi:hypothetical protein
MAKGSEGGPGPSPNDPGLGGSKGGGGSADTMSAPAPIEQALPTGGGPPTEGTTGAAIGATPPMQFGVGTSFGADTTAMSGAGQQGGFNTGGVFNTIANPTGGGGGGGGDVFSTGTTPFQSYGGSSGVSPVTGATGGDPTGATGMPTGGMGSPTSAAAAGVPTGVAPTLPPDPTQQGGGGVPQRGGSGGFSLDSLFSNISKSVTSNPMSFLGGAGMLYNAYQSNQALKGLPPLGQSTGALQEQAAQLNAQGQQLAQYLTSGTLPPGLKASLDQATSAAKSHIISNYAARGMSTDPNHNTSLAQELAAVDAQAVISTAQMGQQLMQTGIQETGLSSSLYTTLANIDQAATQRLSQSIANFAAAMSPTRGSTIRIGG